MRSQPSAQRGFTMVEAVIVLTLMTFAISVIANVIASTSSTQKYTERMARATEVNQLMLNGMRDEILSTVSLITSGTIGDSYLDAMELDGDAPRLRGAQLATVISDGGFHKETTSGEITGNCLLFVRQAWTTELTCPSGTVYLVDVYRLVSYYESPEDGGPRPDSPIGLNLSKYVSEPLIDGAEIDRIADDDDREQMLIHLANGTVNDLGETHQRAKLVWLRNQDIGVNGTLREIMPASGRLSDTPLSPRPHDRWHILRDPQLSESDMLNYRHFSVATNYGDTRLGIARFGLLSNEGAGFPHGFEVQVSGAGAVRQVLMHLSIVTTNNEGTRAHSDLRCTVFVHDI